MDAKLRDLERQFKSSGSNIDLVKWLSEINRATGKKEVKEYIGEFYLVNKEFTLESFSKELLTVVNKSIIKYLSYTFTIPSWEHSCCDDYRCGFEDIRLMIYGVRLETDTECKNRLRQEKERQEAIEKSQREVKDRRKKQDQKIKDHEYLICQQPPPEGGLVKRRRTLRNQRCLLRLGASASWRLAWLRCENVCS